MAHAVPTQPEAHTETMPTQPDPGTAMGAVAASLRARQATRVGIPAAQASLPRALPQHAGRRCGMTAIRRFTARVLTMFWHAQGAPYLAVVLRNLSRTASVVRAERRKVAMPGP